MKSLSTLVVLALFAACSSAKSSSSSSGGSTNNTSSGAGGRESTTSSGSGPGSTTSSGSSTTSTSGSTSGNGGASSTSTSGAGGMASSSTSGAGGAGGDPYNTPVMCSSNKMYSGGNNQDMHPGVNCKQCHVLGGQATGKTFDIGGTVYPTAHEPDDCDGVSVAGAQVIITDANGQDHPLDVSPASGNFHHEDLFGFVAFPVPYHAKVVFNGKERKMSAAQTSGDCNSCHTETGKNNAPGRILLP